MTISPLTRAASAWLDNPTLDTEQAYLRELIAAWKADLIGWDEFIEGIECVAGVP